MLHPAKITFSWANHYWYVSKGWADHSEEMLREKAKLLFSITFVNSRKNLLSILLPCCW